jgi:hypothetical protein
MIGEQILDRLRGMQSRKLSCRSPIWVDIFSVNNKDVASAESGYLVDNVDCSQFSLALIFTEVTFSAAANVDFTVDVRARPPGRSDYSLEPIARCILSYNTVSPYKRYYWLPFDIRFVDNLAIYYSHPTAAAGITLDNVGFRLVV